MTFVDMPGRWRKARRAQRPHAADTEHHLLPDAHRLVTTIQTPGDISIVGAILGAIGIEQNQRDAADQRAPQAHDHIAPGNPQSHLQPLAVRASERLHGQIARVMVAVLRVLHAIVVDPLREVTLPV